MARQFSTFTDLQIALAALNSDEHLPVLVTPELAAEILGHDPVNRKVRRAKLLQLIREITGGHWDPRKSTAMRFLPTQRLADGQHRCLAVIETKTAIIVPVCLVSDTVGVDEGAARTLADHLQLSYGFDEDQAALAAAVTKALEHVSGAGNRDYLDYFKAHEIFIRECVSKPLEWLADQQPSVSKVFKPVSMAVLRARAISENEQPAESVDQLLYDAINGGATAPDGSPRRALAKQFFDAMHDAFSKRGKRPEMLKWLLAALKAERDGQIKNILTMRMPSKKKRRVAQAA